MCKRSVRIYASALTRKVEDGYVRGRCPYHNDVLILETMLALKHPINFKEFISFILGFVWFSRLEEHLNMTYVF